MGVSLDIKVNLDSIGIKNRLNGATERAQAKLDAQVLKDSNYYCPMDTGMLQKSAILSTVIGSGVIRWNTPYAAEQYYSKPNKSHQKNPNASCKWFEVAKAKNLKNWIRLVNDEFSKNN